MIRQSTPDIEGVFQASKWVHIAVFPSCDELEKLFSTWENCRLFFIGAPLKKEEAEIRIKEFVHRYGSLLDELKKGNVPGREEYKKISPLAATISLDALYLMQLQEKHIVKVINPVVQIQAHFFRFSSVDSSFHSGAMGKDCLYWGLTFSYPGLFLDPKTGDIGKKSDNHPLFQSLRKWSRDFTLPTRFLLPNGQKVNVPFRLGKDLFSWISTHPSLKDQSFSVEVYNEN